MIDNSDIYGTYKVEYTDAKKSLQSRGTSKKVDGTAEQFTAELKGNQKISEE